MGPQGLAKYRDQQTQEDETMHIHLQLLEPRQQDSTGLLFLKLLIGKFVIPAAGALTILCVLYAAVVVLSMILSR
jgi:hypothetical protein